MLLSIIIPVYKSSKSLIGISDQLHWLKKDNSYNMEIIFVNDSPFFLETNKALKELEDSSKIIKVITMRKNVGQHMALLVGINNSSGDFVVTMDDDLQHPVEEIPKLLETLLENSETEAIFAIPDPALRKHNIWRNFGSSILNRIDVVFLEKPKGLIKSSFKIFTRELADIVVMNSNASPSLSSLIIDSTFRIKNVVVAHNERGYGRSNYNFSRLLNLALNNLLHYSSIPLKLIGIIGILGLLISFIFILFILYKKIFYEIDFPGYSSTIILVSLFGGLNLFASGVIGEYLIRIIKEQQKKDLKTLIK